MEKKFEEDDGLKEQLEEQYIKEAEALEAALFSDREFQDYEQSDEEVQASYEKLVARLRAEGIYREDEDSRLAGSSDSKPSDSVPNSSGFGSSGLHPAGHTEEKILVMPAPAKPEKRKRSRSYHGIARVAGVGLVSAICIFAASMTSEANRRYFINSVRYLAGDDTRIVIDNNTNNEMPNGNEYEAIADIEEKLEVEVPEFMYRPWHFEYVNYKINTHSGTAWIEYQYDGKIIAFVIDKEDDNSSSVIDSEHGDTIDTIEISDESITTNIKVVQNIEDDMPNYSARWEKDSVIYTISGKMELEEFRKLIEKIKF